MATMVENSEEPPKGLPASLAGFEDQASFSIILNEENLGTRESTWRPDGSFEARSIVSLAGQTVQSTVTIVPDNDGRWKDIVNRSPLGVRTSVREGISVTRTFKSDAQELINTYETPLGAVLFDNDAPALISQALRLYDHNKGGAQKFPALIGGRPPVELTLEVKEKNVRNVDGTDLALIKYLYGIIGARDFGQNAIIDLQRDYLRWFDRWLKGIDNGIEREPLVSVFVMGANEWQRGATYPLEATQYQKLYLTSGGRANTSHGDGKLTFDPPAANTPPDRYVYDPGDPTPDFRAYEESEEDKAKARSAEERKKEAEEYHRKIAEQRDDILVYETDPLGSG